LHTKRFLLIALLEQDLCARKLSHLWTKLSCEKQQFVCSISWKRNYWRTCFVHWQPRF